MCVDVYERLTRKGRKASFQTLLTTQIVSGIWHGLFAGYAMFFINSAFMFESGKARCPLFSCLLDWCLRFLFFMVIKDSR